jgi:NNP family nitrate/nitrite transporter-like MFS transporter
MILSDFRRAGHWPTLVAAFVYFDISFMVWVMLGALGNALAADFHLSPGQKGFMVALPILGGAILRIAMGLITDRLGARRAALIGLGLTTIPLLLGWLWVSRFEQLLVVGLALGIAGASFAAALPLAGRWYPPRYQGLVLGIAGAGNSGTALATFFAPRIAASWGWRPVFGAALVPVALAWALLYLLARDAPGRPPARPFRDYLAPLKTRDAWWFCLLYSVTFGGFSGLASFLSIFFHDQYALSAIDAGNFATLCVIAGSFFRPLGGLLADHFGGIRVLLVLFMGVAVAMASMTALPALTYGATVLFAGMALLGMGNGAVFQLVPQRYPKEIGVMTGLVGSAGGLGGFLLPSALGTLKGLSGSFAGGFLLFALTGVICCMALAALAEGWQQGFVGRGGVAVESTPLSP